MVNDPFSGFSGSTVMEINGLKCTLNLPKILKGKYDSQGEIKQGLPPYAPRPAFLVDEYLGCPSNWKRSSRTESSYFSPVLADHGLWLDFNANQSHTHHVAILISIQGINAITPPQKSELKMKQFNSCPIHGIDFGAHLFCEKCGYKWPPQNYLATTGTPHGLLWLDGFRVEDGTVRQFYFTEEEMRGIAAQIIGEDRVFALGVSFFLSREPKPRQTRPDYDYFAYQPLGVLGGSTYKGASRGSHGSRLLGLNSPDFEVKGGDSVQVRKSLEIGAGAKIVQKVYQDPNGLDFWQEKPAGIIYINYVDSADALRIIAEGKRDLTADGEGPLRGLNVGAPFEAKC